MVQICLGRILKPDSCSVLSRHFFLFNVHGKFTNTNALTVTKEFDDVCVEVEMELTALPPPLHDVSSSNIIKNAISLFFDIF